MSSPARSEYIYGWITDPPIIELAEGDSGRDADTKRYALQLLQDVTAWSSGLAAPVPGPEGKGVPLPGVIEKAKTMCQTIHDAKLGFKEVVFVYPLAGRPVAIMIFSPSLGTDDKGEDCGYVCDVVVHPGVDFGGAIMLEYALNYLRKKSISQALQLWALDDSTELLGSYHGFGFAQTAGQSSTQDLTLLPLTKTAKWALTDSGWRYKSTRPMGPLYAAARKTT